MIAFLLCGVRGAVQAELDAFFAHLARRAELVRTVSAQAFSKARQHLRADVFGLLNAHLVGLAEREGLVARWRGLRVVAADATTLRLTQCEAGVRRVVEAVAFGLFLPGLELCLGCALYPLSCGERQMLFEHLERLGEKDLLVLDRGYPAAWLAAVLSQSRLAFCMRCHIGRGFRVVREFARGPLQEAIVSLPAPYARLAGTYECAATLTRVRLIRVVAPNGRVIVLMTSLLDAEQFPASEFGTLYHARWRIEEAFKRLKHRLNLEHTSGLSWQAAVQDLGAKAVCDNLNALAAWCAHDHAIEDPAADHDKVNRTLAFNILKRLCPRWLLVAVPSARKLAAVFEEIVRHLQRFRAGRHRPRPHRLKPHKHFAYKPAV